MTLDPRIEVIREKYGLERADFWELPQKKGTLLVKHAALEIAAAKAEIRFDLPQILEANGAEGVAAVCVQGVMGGRVEWSIGEASPKNSRNAYPWAMAEKRAKDRVILKLLGIHGLVYSEDEMPESEPAPMPKAKSRDVYADMQAEIDACLTPSDLRMLWTSKAFQAEYKSLPHDWQDQLAERKDARKAELSNAPARTGYIAPNFDGATS